ncbi:MAG: sodium-independent anion transporter, partial [Thalassobium sp.]
MKFSNTLRGYQRQWLPADITAGLIVTILLIPQSIAYALLAGLPPVAGLYASLLPLAVYAFLGTSPTLAIGPVAIVSLMTLDALLPFAAAGTAEFAAHATVLAGLTGIWLLVFFAVGLGSWTSFMSHSVISGFTSAAAIVIIINQLKYFTGIDIPHGGGSWFPIAYTLEHWHEAVPMALMMSVASILVLIFWQGYVPKIMSRWKMSAIILP